MALLFAFLSLLFAGLNDFLFKFYSSRNVSRGLYFCVIGIIMTGVFIFRLDFSRIGPDNMSSTLIWGGVSGLFSIAANILLIEGMAWHEAGVCSAVYRLNFVSAAVFAFVMMGELVTIPKTTGILCAAFAVVFFIPPRSGGGQERCDKFSRLALVLVAGANFLRAGMGIAYKHGLSEGAILEGVLVLNGVLWAVGGILYVVLKEKGVRGCFSHAVFFYGVFSGLLICGIVFFMACALNCGESSVVLPVSQMSFVVTCALGMLILKESVTVRKAVGLILCVLCIILMSAV